MGAVADWLGRRGIGLLHVMLGYIAAFLTVQLAIVLQWTSAASLLWLIFGMVGQSGILAYPWLSRYFGVGSPGGPIRRSTSSPSPPPSRSST
jgi:hypothetical protein